MWRRVASQSPTSAPSVGPSDGSSDGSSDVSSDGPSDAPSIGSSDDSTPRATAGPSPASTSEISGASAISGGEFASNEDYLRAWEALGKLLANGRSLSGRERNCAFLNTGEAAFANISATSGFDFPDDTRAVAVTDWDGDGDLDVWTTNRTAPRVRFLRNESSTKHHYLTVRLQGTSGNRDAIGARVEVRDASGAKLVKSLRAGEGYLAQSSKFLHFGLGDHGQEAEITVRWPGGSYETFSHVQVDQRVVLVEGSGRAVPDMRPQLPQSVVANGDSISPSTRDKQLTHATVPSEAPGHADENSSQRIMLPARLPMPRLVYRGVDGDSVTIPGYVPRPTIGGGTRGKAYLINLWATWCQPCLRELAQWRDNQPLFAEAGVEVVLLCVDDVAGLERDQTESTTGEPRSTSATELLSRMQVPFASGFATDALLDTLDVTQHVLTKRTRPMPVPTSFLVDALGRLVAVYKGPVSLGQLTRDLQQLDAPDDQHRDLASAYPGRWYTNPFPPDVMAIAGEFRDRDQAGEALDYLLHVTGATGKPLADHAFFGVDRQVLFGSFTDLAKLLQTRHDSGRVIAALRAAVSVAPENPQGRMALAMVAQQQGDYSEVVTQYRQLLSRSPADVALSNNLAWLLATGPERATCAKEAIGLAERVCQRTSRKLPTALDTLAAAYAADNQFELAVNTLREAIGLQSRSTSADAAQAMQARLQRYERGESFLDPSWSANTQ